MADRLFPRDAAMDVFTAACLQFTSTPYIIRGKDAVHLAALRRAFGVEHRTCPPDWEAAVENYFATPQRSYSLADLSKPERYCVFRNSPLDRYGKPTNHVNYRRNYGTDDSETTHRRDQEAAVSAYLRLFGGAQGRI